MAYFFPSPTCPLISGREIESMIFDPIFPGNFQQVVIYLFCFGLLVSAWLLMSVSKIVLDLMKGNRLSKSLGICWAFSLPLTPILFGLGSDILKTTVGIPFCFIAGIILGFVIWLIYIFIMDTSSRLFGTVDIFK